MTSENNTPIDALPNPGFVVDAETQPQNPVDEKAARQQARDSKKQEMQRNFKAVFGHGIGKLSLILAALIILGGAALGYRGLTKPQSSGNDDNKSQFDVPSTPNTKAGVDEVSASEAERRKEIASKEALEAEAAGKAYQPAFDPAIRPDDEKVDAKGGQTQFSIDMEARQAQIEAAADANASKENKRSENKPSASVAQVSAKSPILLPEVKANPDESRSANGNSPQSSATPGQSSATPGQSSATPGQSKPTNNQQTTSSLQSNDQRNQPTANPATNQRAQQQPTQAEQQAAQKLADEYRKMVEKRDKYVDSIEKDTMAAVSRMYGSEAQNALGTYSTSVYSSPLVKEQAATTAQAAPQSPSLRPEVLGDPRKRLLIKTGNLMYFTLDSEVNTDDGGIVMGTIRGGNWNGARIIGGIEQAPNNIRIKITTIAPQDSRPTIRVNAVALREVDAKQGIAETIDHHTFSRYASLAAASALTGYGKAYQQPAGTTIMSGTGMVTSTTTDPSNKRVVGNIIGELGQATGQEVRRGFNRPSTFATPAETGMALYFLQDVFEQ